jgi:hypothetical protein
MTTPTTPTKKREPKIVNSDDPRFETMIFLAQEFLEHEPLEVVIVEGTNALNLSLTISKDRLEDRMLFDGKLEP